MGAAMEAKTPPEFDVQFRDKLVELLVWRRDVWRFRTDPIAAGSLSITQK
jgi:hypothetical protein